MAISHSKLENGVWLLATQDSAKRVTHSFSEGLQIMYFVYLLKLSNNKIYTGSTPDINNRVKEHNQGFCESTKNFRPIELIWYCAFNNRLSARRFEAYLKTGSGQAFRYKHLI